MVTKQAQSNGRVEPPERTRMSRGKMRLDKLDIDIYQGS